MLFNVILKNLDKFKVLKNTTKTLFNLILKNLDKFGVLKISHGLCFKPCNALESVVLNMTSKYYYFQT